MSKSNALYIDELSEAHETIGKLRSALQRMAFFADTVANLTNNKEAEKYATYAKYTLDKTAP